MQDSKNVYLIDFFGNTFQVLGATTKELASFDFSSRKSLETQLSKTSAVRIRLIREGAATSKRDKGQGKAQGQRKTQNRNNKLSTLHEQGFALLQAEEGFPLRDIQSVFKEHTDEKKATLLFHAHHWRMTHELPSVFAPYKAPGKTQVLDLSSMSVRALDEKCKARVFPVTPLLAIQEPPMGKAQTVDSLAALLSPSPSLRAELDVCVRALHCVSSLVKRPGVLMSLLQKSIRFYTDSFRIRTPTGPVVVTSRGVFLFAFLSLCVSPPKYDPEHHTTRRGLEHALRRLVVTLLEDSYVRPEDHVHLLRAIACASFLSREESWWPPAAWFLEWIRIGLAGVAEPRSFFWSVDPSTETAKAAINWSSPLFVLNHVWSALPSMPGDRLMIASIAKQNGAALPTKDSTSQKRAMYAILNPLRQEECALESALDQHCSTDITWLFDPALVKESSKKTDANPKTLEGDAKTPFAPLYKQWFRQVSGNNPRRFALTHTPFSAMVREAQARAWDLYVSDGRESKAEESKTENNVETKTENKTFAVSMEDLSACVGVRNVKIGSRTYSVCLPTEEGGVVYMIVQPKTRRQVADQASRLKKTSAQSSEEKGVKRKSTNFDAEERPLKKGPAVPNASSSSSSSSSSQPFTDFTVVEQESVVGEESIIDDSTRAKVFAAYLDLLSKGLPLHTGTLPHESWQGATLFYERSKTDRPDLPLQGTLSLRFSSSSATAKVPWSQARLLTLSLPINAINTLPAASSLNVLYQTLRAARELGTSYQFPRISRDGGAPQSLAGRPAEFVDLEVCRILSSFPPSLVRRTAPDTFRILCPLAVKSLFRDWFEREKERLEPTPALSPSDLGNRLKVWGPMKRVKGDSNEFQKWMLAHLIDDAALSSVQGVWAPVGAGKTALAFLLLFDLLRSMQLSASYAVWCTPAHLFSSVIAEAKLFGLRVCVWKPESKESSNKSSNKSSNRSRTHLDVPVVSDPRKAPAGTLVLAAHDDVRKDQGTLLESVRSTLLVVDEVHKLWDASTQRSIYVTRLLVQARRALWMTGTAVCADDLELLSRAVQPMVWFSVTPQNALVATSRVRVAAPYAKIPASFAESTAPITEEERKRLKACTTASLGGTLSPAQLTNAHTEEAKGILSAALDRELVRAAAHYAADQKHGGVLLAANNGPHAEQLANALASTLGSSAVRFFSRSSASPLAIPPRDVCEASALPGVRVVACPLSLSDGLNLQKLNVGVLFAAGGAAFKADQFRGRIRRPGQTRPVLYHLVRDALGFDAAKAAKLDRARSLADALLRSSAALV